jgi:hypothetical protein
VRQSATTRKKNGKEHRYWNLVENRRVAGGQVVQRQVLYLGEINDSQQEVWRKSAFSIVGVTRPTIHWRSTGKVRQFCEYSHQRPGMRMEALSWYWRFLLMIILARRLNSRESGLSTI